MLNLETETDQTKIEIITFNKLVENLCKTKFCTIKLYTPAGLSGQYFPAGQGLQSAASSLPRPDILVPGDRRVNKLGS